LRHEDLGILLKIGAWLLTLLYLGLSDEALGLTDDVVERVHYEFEVVLL
jgi:hypothetical protein